MMIDPALELQHTLAEIRDLTAQLTWLRRYRRLCEHSAELVPIAVWQDQVKRVEQLGSQDRTRLRLMSDNTELTDLVASIRPTLNSHSTTERERAYLLYDLIREVYDHVKFDVHEPSDDTEERARIGEVLNAALPPTDL